jgi:hypothetical protein
MLGTGEGSVGRRPVADKRIDADVRAVILMQQRRPGFCGIRREGHARQRRVVDHEPLSAVLGRTKRFRNYDSGRFAGKAHLVVRQRKIRCDERR